MRSKAPSTALLVGLLLVGCTSAAAPVGSLGTGASASRAATAASPTPSAAVSSPSSSAAASQPSPPPAASSRSTPTAVEIADFAFSPARITVPVGATVIWTHADGEAHTVQFADVPSSGLMKRGDAYQRTFDTAGSFRYVCGIHSAMTGMVIVR